MKKTEAISGLITATLGLIVLVTCTVVFFLFLFAPEAFLAGFNERIIHGNPLILGFIVSDLAIIGVAGILLLRMEKSSDALSNKETEAVAQ